MEFLCRFLFIHILAPDRAGQLEFLTFGLCHPEHIPCGRWLQLQQRFIDRQCIPRYFQASAQAFQHFLLLNLAIGKAFQQVFAPTIRLARCKRYLRYSAFGHQQTIDFPKQVKSADCTDESAGHDRIIPLSTPIPDEAFKPVRIGIAHDAAP